MVQVGGATVELYTDGVSTNVDGLIVQRLVKVANEVNDEPQCIEVITG